MVNGLHRDTGRLLISCPDQPGIVAAVSRYLFEHGANIIDSSQHSTDPAAPNGTFYMRIEFQLTDLVSCRPHLEREFAPLAHSLAMDWRFSLASQEKRLAIFVSHADHALFELLWQRQAGDLRATIAMVISNHPHLRNLVEAWGVPFHHVPVTRERKATAEAEQLALMTGKVDTVVLARYMQIVSPAFISHYPNAVINIHHSFLPAFVGADPYSRAYERGVKLIGATAHYVTEELDAGPIIDQDVQRVDHRHSVADMRRIGRHIERVVLARAVSWHVEDRVIVHGNKTI
ncbi:MAG TPA: formyltetrahydrofolate deformylase, partial [Chloroflexota bacterium]|nr:formyltetrahydrofolate deformylase [Chloroflexota bacterium]